MPEKNMNSSLVLSKAFGALSLATDIETITSTVAEAARRLTGAQGTTFVLRDEDRCYYADENSISPLWKGLRFPMEACISGWSMIHGQVVNIRDIYEDARIPHDAYRPTFVKSLCMVPIRPEKAIGAIGNYWSAEHTPSQEDIKVLQILANSTAVALENLELRNALSKQGSQSENLKGHVKELEVAMFSLGHDLRTPVAAMTSLAELLHLQLGDKLEPEAAQFIQLIMDTGYRTSEQIQRMLSLYRASNGTLDKRSVNLSQMTQESLDRVRLQFPNRPVRANIQADMQAYADPQLLNMVLENLISNALKYSSKKPESQIDIGSAVDHNSGLIYFVRDNGSGFDNADSHKLFKPLGRLHNDKEFAGTGLGLASVAKIIELHGGQVRAEGKKTEGATFFFSLPGM